MTHKTTHAPTVWGRAVLNGGKKGVRNANRTNVHGDVLCFLVKTCERHKTTDAVLNNGWRLAVGGGWRVVAVGGWRLVAVGGGWLLALVVGGGFRLAFGGPWTPS